MLFHLQSVLVLSILLCSILFVYSGDCPPKLGLDCKLPDNIMKRKAEKENFYSCTCIRMAYILATYNKSNSRDGVTKLDKICNWWSLVGEFGSQSATNTFENIERKKNYCVMAAMQMTTGGLYSGSGWNGALDHCCRDARELNRLPYEQHEEHILGKGEDSPKGPKPSKSPVTAMNAGKPIMSGFSRFRSSRSNFGSIYEFNDEKDLNWIPPFRYGF